jgi:uncharacterized protein (DUF302 family)
MSTAFGFEIYLDASYDHSVNMVTEALKSEGFGVLTTIDVQSTLKKKLGKDFRPYVIIGACNPPLAHKALSSDPRVGLMLPCNVTVEALLEGGSFVRIVNPEVMMRGGSMADNREINNVAKEARIRLERVAEKLQTR